MIKLFFLILLFLAGQATLKAAEPPADDQGFVGQLNGVKNPFEDGLPKPVPIVISPPVQMVKPVAPIIVKPAPPPVVPVVPPDLHLQGVVVGDGVFEAIIDDNVVHLHASIQEAEVTAVDRAGVELLYKNKKFFLKIGEHIIEDKNNV